MSGEPEDPTSHNRLQPIIVDFWWPERSEISWQVLRLRGYEELSRPYRFEIEVVCHDPTIDPEELLGVDCELLFERNGLSRTVFGVVAEVELIVAPPLAHELDGVAARVVLVPAFALLEQEIDTRFFMGQTVVDVLRDRLGAALAALGRELDLSRLIGHYNRRDYCVQFRESTFAFCSRLMEEEGIAYVFEPDYDGLRERMVLVDDNEHYSKAELLAPGPVPIVTTAAEELDRESIQAFEWRRRRTANRVVTRAYNYKNPGRHDDGQAERSERGRALVSEHYEHGDQRQIVDDPVDDPEARSFTGAELDQRSALAARLLQQHTIAGTRGRGRANAIGFTAGARFELGESLEFAAGERELLLVRVEHDAEIDETLGGSASYSNRFECTPKSQAFRPARRTPRPRVYGVQTGVVVGRSDEEIHTDPLGRVRVKFHHDRREGDDEHSSCWIRVAQMWAGNGYGAMIIPRVGMEVVVSFVDGNPDCPLVTGSVYHAGNLPPYELPEQLSKATLKTRSTPGGDGFHELRVEDERGREQVFVHAQRRMDLRVRGVLYATSTGGREDVIGREDHSYSSDNPLENSHNVRVHGPLCQKIGEHFYYVDGGLYRTIGQEVVEDYQTTHTISVAERSQLNASDVIVEATAVISHKARKLELAGSSSVSVKGGDRVVLQSNNRLELVVGQSFLALTPTGVEIGGDSVRINSGGGAIGRARDGVAAESVEIGYPVEALAADDGRIREGGGGGGGGGRRREIEWYTIEPRHAPPMEPTKPTKPTKRPDGPHRLVSLQWIDRELWCSEPATLRVNSEGYDGSVAETLILENEADGAPQCVDVVRPVAPTQDLAVEVIDVVPRRIGETVEAERKLLASAGGTTTPVEALLKFVSEVPKTGYYKGRARFNVAIHNHEVVIGSTIEFKRGWMHYIIRLGELADSSIKRIGGTYYGSDDWLYCKAVSDDDGVRKFVYWNNSAWVDVPEAWTNPLGTRRCGMGVWREREPGSDQTVVKTQFGREPWPDPVPETWTRGSVDGVDRVELRLSDWATNIARSWSGNFDIERNECRGHDLHCCRYRVRCEVAFAETEVKTKRGIILANNLSRANASCWPYDVDLLVVAHEFGHHLGNPDEYPGATSVDVTVNGDGAKAGIDPDSIMGTGEAYRRRHYNFVCAALSKAVAEHLGKHYTYSPVDPA